MSKNKQPTKAMPTKEIDEENVSEDVNEVIEGVAEEEQGAADDMQAGDETQTEPVDEEAADESSQTTGQTVQGMQPYFEIAQSDQDGLYHWQLWSKNGRRIAENSIGYKTMHDCKSAIQTFNGMLGKALKIVVAHTS